jgi:alanine-glyoxylate transaminase/serine-glyoxylate transaminase/serine-pyruvate transaminase
MTAQNRNIPQRTLMGPGPLDIHPRVYQAMGAPLLSHLDPAYLAIVRDVGVRLQSLFGTKNAITNAAPGTGTSGMETAVVNLIEPGDKVLCCVHGYFGDRLRQMAERQGAEVTVVESQWGSPTDPAAIEQKLKQGGFKLITLVHAETSTGVLQPMDDVARVAKQHGAMIVLDTVTSLGGVSVSVDAWGVDAAYSCSQKCIGSPPGLAPVTFSERALEAAQNRKRVPPSFYLDIQLLDQYWRGAAYHHTSSSSLNYALHEALVLIEEEGLERRIARHHKNHQALVAGVEAMGLQMLVAPRHRLPSLNTVRVPDGADDVKVRGYLLEKLNLEIGGGLGQLKGKVWRVGLMGHSSSAERILFFLSALSQALQAQGVKTDLAAGLAASQATLLNAT